MSHRQRPAPLDGNPRVALASCPQVYIFSRNCEDRTDSYPDVCTVVREAARGSRGKRAGGGQGPTAGTGPGTTAATGAAAGTEQQPAGGGEAERAGLSQPGGGGAGVERRGEAEVAAGKDGSVAEAGGQRETGAQGSCGVGGDGDGGGSGLGPGCGSESCVLDAEVVAVEWLGGQQEGAEAGLGAGEGGGPPYRLRSFQELATRARGQVEEHEVRLGRAERQGVQNIAAETGWGKGAHGG